MEDGTTARGNELLVSVGRHGRVGEIGLETTGLDPKAKAVEVDDRMRAGDDCKGLVAELERTPAAVASPRARAPGTEHATGDQQSLD